jgi:hypothetical protein
MTPLPAIRLAMLGGVLLFGGVSWFLTNTPDWTAPEPGVASQLTVVARIAWVIVGVALTILFLKFRDSTNAARASSVAILSWALGETLALLGGVVFFLTAAAGWYIGGVIALTLTFVAFPAPPRLPR